MVSLVRYAKEKVSPSPTKAIPLFYQFQRGHARARADCDDHSSPRRPSHHLTTDSHRRFHHHRCRHGIVITSSVGRKTFTITLESCSRSAGICVHHVLETVTTMSRNLRATSAAVRKLLVEREWAARSSWEAYTSGNISQPEEEVASGQNGLPPPRHKARLRTFRHLCVNFPSKA
jgi:hypothetical protein